MRSGKRSTTEKSTCNFEIKANVKFGATNRHQNVRYESGKEVQQEDVALLLHSDFEFSGVGEVGHE